MRVFLLFLMLTGGFAHGMEKLSSCTVEADSVVYTGEKTTNTLILKGNVIITMPEVGKAITEEVAITDRLIDGKREWKTLQAVGKTSLVYHEIVRNQDHILTSPKGLLIDHAKQKIFIDSTGCDQQICFKDYMGTVYTDTAMIDYDWTENAFTFKKIHLEGNVRIHNHFASMAQSTPLEQYALADTVIYFPTTHTMTLLADPQKKVLFFDKANQLQVSAKQVSMTRDPETKKDRIQGIGDVRFTFADKEFEKLYQEFHVSPRGEN